MKWLLIVGFWLFYYNLAFSQKSSVEPTIQPSWIPMTKQIPIVWFGSGFSLRGGKVQILKTKQPDNQNLIPDISSLDVFLIQAIQEGKLTIYQDSLCSKLLLAEDYKKLQNRIKQEKCFQKLAIEKEIYTNAGHFPRATAIYHTLYYDSLKCHFYVVPKTLGFYYYDTVSDSSECGFSCDKSVSKVFWLPISPTKTDLKNNPNITFAKRLFYDYEIVYEYVFHLYRNIYHLDYDAADSMQKSSFLQNKIDFYLLHQAKTLSERADSLLIYKDIGMSDLMSHKQKHNLTEELIPGEVYEVEQPDGRLETIEKEAYFVPLNFKYMNVAIGLDFYWDHQAGQLWLRQHTQGARRDIYDDNGNFLQKKSWYHLPTKN